MSTLPPMLQTAIDDLVFGQRKPTGCAACARAEAEIERLTRREAHLVQALNRVALERDTAMEAVYAMRNMLPLAKDPSTLLSVLESIMDKPEARGETPLLEVE